VRVRGETIDLSATDLSNFLSCRHKTGLDLAAAQSKILAPHWIDPLVEALRERGAQHEHGYVESLRVEGLDVLDLNDTPTDEAMTRTVEAMRAGVSVIVQAVLRNDRWLARPDVLRRTETPSRLGPWSYEAYDTKLARETRAGTILQLAIYSDLIADLQGLTPTCFHVVTPVGSESYRVDDFAAYYRLVKAQLVSTVVNTSEQILNTYYPDPVTHCDACRWHARCEQRRRQDDHLSFVAGISRLQRDELQAVGVDTLAKLAAMGVPLEFRPSRGAVATYERIRDQASLQLERRETGRLAFKMLPVVKDEGLACLPAPAPGDLFLDLEGDPFARDGGREYLFGLGSAADDGSWRYQSWWSFSDADERLAFEAIIDAIIAEWERKPDLHIYHFAPYEPAAFKRLMGRHATREQQIDRLLRAERFVDLHSIVKHSLRASVENYSIKELEAFYGFNRKVELQDAGVRRQVIERALELNVLDLITPEVRGVVAGYNEDDCRSTSELRNWLESLRSGLIDMGTVVPRPQPEDGTPPENVAGRVRRADALRQVLLEDVPPDATERTADQHGHWLLAYLLDWHRRENSAGWWEYYRLRDLAEDDLFDEPKAVAAIRFEGRVDVVLNKRTNKPTGSVIDRYSYPEQEMEIDEGETLILKDETKLGRVEAVDRGARTFDVKKAEEHADVHPTSAFAFHNVPNDVLQDSVMDFAESVILHGLSPNLGCRRDVLLRNCPRLRSGPFAAGAEESAVAFAARIADDLDDCVLPIQGPPGAGKTHAGAKMICELIKRGLRVGVTAQSHKVIRHLLDEVVRLGDEQGIRVRAGHRVNEETGDDETIRSLKTNAAALDVLLRGEANVVGGTAWLWASAEFAPPQNRVDVLFVDEAGQMSLANVLAVCRATKSAVLLGDPQQLQQPRKGSHPDGVDVSALRHILGEHQTIPAERGIFLPETWRLPPPICSFTSEIFYEGKLHAKPGLENRRVERAGPLNGAGLWWLPVVHDGNQNWSAEEVDAVFQIVTMLTTSGGRWINERGDETAIASQHILVVAPYNAHVSRLTERLNPLGVRVGTVDKFQGQQAPIVIYSMATSRPEDAPRGMEFLYSLNRLNVATSRAQAVCILTSSPLLFEPDCKTPRQMRLANALCRYRELATELVVRRQP
jgi:predicted RecB family nuclease